MSDHDPTAAGPGDPPPARDYLVVLRLLPGQGPGLVRLRRALKCLLRSFQIRCITLAPVEDGKPPAPPAAPKQRRRY